MKILITGLILSFLITNASWLWWGYFYHDHMLRVVMFLFAGSPFLVLYGIFRKNLSNNRFLVPGALFLLLHVFVLVQCLRARPQEFGDVGLIAVPFLEVVIVAPASVAILLFLGRSR